MRADSKVYFVTEGEPVYDPDTGDYIPGEDNKVRKFGNVSDTASERMGILYGGIKQRAKTIRLNSVYKESFDHVLIDDSKYQLDVDRHYRHKSVFEVSGV